MTNSRQVKIANILRRTGNKKCFIKAEVLEKELSSMNILTLRDLGLNSSNIITIVNDLKQVK